MPTTDYFKKVGAGTVTTMAAPGKALAATSINVGSTANMPTSTGIVIAIRTVDAQGELVAGTYTEWSATVASATSLAIVAVPVYGNDQAYTAGSTTQVFIPASSYAHNTLVDGILVFHNQDGTLKDGIVTADKIAAEAWTASTPAVTNATATAACRHIKIGKTVFFEMTISYTGSGSGQLAIALPVAAATFYAAAYSPFGTAVGQDSGTGVCGGLVVGSDAAAGRLMIINPASTPAALAIWGTTAPFTWANGDKIFLSGTYEAA